MGCNKTGLTAIVYSKLTKSIVKGSDGSIVVSILQSDSKEPEKLVDFVGATGYFSKDDDTACTIVGSLNSEDQGRLGFEIPSSESVSLMTSDAATFQVKAEWGGKSVIFVIEDSLEITEPIF